MAQRGGANAWGDVSALNRDVHLICTFTSTPGAPSLPKVDPTHTSFHPITDIFVWWPALRLCYPHVVEFARTPRKICPAYCAATCNVHLKSQKVHV